MRLSTLFRSAATGDATGSGWRTPLAIMVAIQAVTVTVAAVALSGASATVTTLVLVGWAVTLVLITALTALLHAAGRVVIEAQRLREMHLILGSAGYLSGGIGDPDDAFDDLDDSVEPLDRSEREGADAPRRRWDGFPTVQLPLMHRRARAQEAGSPGPALPHEDAPADMPPAAHPEGAGSATGHDVAGRTPDPVDTPPSAAAPDSHAAADDARWFPTPSGSTAVNRASFRAPTEHAPADGPSAAARAGAPDVPAPAPEPARVRPAPEVAPEPRPIRPVADPEPSPEPDPAAHTDGSPEHEEPTESLVSQLAERRSSAARATLAALAAFPTEPPAPVRRTSVRNRTGSRSVGSLR